MWSPKWRPLYRARCSEQTRRKTVTQSHGATADRRIVRHARRAASVSTVCRNRRPIFLRANEEVPMTFKHKLSVRLALLKDVLPVVPVLALLAACEQPSLVGPPIKTSINVSTIVTLPDSITLDPGQTRQFASYGRTPDGDSVAINVTWQAVGGGLISASGLYTAGTLQGDYAVKATLV